MVNAQQVISAGRAAVEKVERAAGDSTSAAQKWLEKAKEKAIEAKKKVSESTAHAKREAAEVDKITKDKVKESSQAIQDTVSHYGHAIKEKAGENAEALRSSVSNIAEEVKAKVSEDTEMAALVHKAEDALRRPAPETAVQAGTDISNDLSQPVYTGSLPIGFEAPPGFVLPSKRKTVADASLPTEVESLSAPPPLPLIAPHVTEFSSSEPILAQLASTIDVLTSFLKGHPSADTAKDVIQMAEIDLIKLGERLEEIKTNERRQLEAKLEEQTKEYSLQFLQLEMEAQERLDQQGEDWRKYAEMERQQIIQAYRAKLEAELQAQSEIINQRLKEEVVAQGIELQRRWIREIQVKVEEERGGRLAKLDVLAANLKRLSKVTLENSSYLDENLRMHALWSSLRVLTNIIQDSKVRQPFREELRTLRHTAGASEDAVLAAAIEALERSDMPDVGVEPFADLASWFTTSVAQRVSSVALVPDEHAGVLFYLASSLLSVLRFRRKGLVEGNDVLSVLARAEYYMNEKDLDSATRELNQLQGPAKLLLNDWLEAARRRLEVLQALEVMQTEATLSSLLLA